MAGHGAQALWPALRLCNYTTANRRARLEEAVAKVGDEQSVL